ncbi:hypothetical protein ACOMHN_044753 [Nucella lapillus]
MGQAVISWRLNTALIITTYGSRRTEELLVAQRLVTVVVANILAWIVTGVLGVSAAIKIHVAEEVHVFVTVLVLSLSSALSPVLYAMSVVLQERRQKQERILLTILARQKGTQQHSKSRCIKKKD